MRWYSLAAQNARFSPEVTRVRIPLPVPRFSCSSTVRASGCDPEDAGSTPVVRSIHADGWQSGNALVC